MIIFDSNELEKRIDEVLFYIWDPIGVCDEPNARWEYKSYVPEILPLVIENDNIEPISTCLAEIITSRMGLLPNKKLCDYTADVLLRHKNAIENGYA